MYTLNIYTCQLKGKGEDCHSSGWRGRRQTEELRFGELMEMAGIWGNLD